MKIAGVDVVAGTLNKMNVPILPSEKRVIEKVIKKPDGTVFLGLLLPANFDPTKPQHVMVASVTSDGEATNFVALGEMKDTILAKGWIGLSADGPIKPDGDNFTPEWHWACISSALAEIEKAWPQAKTWSYAAGGFSGGAKRSGYTAALFAKAKYNVPGLFMGGCNYDTASYALQSIRPSAVSFKKVPVFLSSGTSDTVATPADHAEVKKSLERTGFKNVRLESYAAAHVISQEQLGMALDWFKEMAAKSPTIGGGATSTGGSALDQFKQMQKKPTP